MSQILKYKIKLINDLLNYIKLNVLVKDKKGKVNYKLESLGEKIEFSYLIYEYINSPDYNSSIKIILHDKQLGNDEIELDNLKEKLIKIDESPYNYKEENNLLKRHLLPEDIESEYDSNDDDDRKTDTTTELLDKIINIFYIKKFDKIVLSEEINIFEIIQTIALIYKYRISNSYYKDFFIMKDFIKEEIKIKKYFIDIINLIIDFLKDNKILLFNETYLESFIYLLYYNREVKLNLTLNDKKQLIYEENGKIYRSIEYIFYNKYSENYNKSFEMKIECISEDGNYFMDYPKKIIDISIPEPELILKYKIDLLNDLLGSINNNDIKFTNNGLIVKIGSGNDNNSYYNINNLSSPDDINKVLKNIKKFSDIGNTLYSLSHSIVSIFKRIDKVIPIFSIIFFVINVNNILESYHNDQYYKDYKYVKDKKFYYTTDLYEIKDLNDNKFGNNLLPKSSIYLYSSIITKLEELKIYISIKSLVNQIIFLTYQDYNLSEIYFVFIKDGNKIIFTEKELLITLEKLYTKDNSRKVYRYNILVGTDEDTTNKYECIRLTEFESGIISINSIVTLEKDTIVEDRSKDVGVYNKPWLGMLRWESMSVSERVLFILLFPIILILHLIYLIREAISKRTNDGGGA